MEEEISKPSVSDLQSISFYDTSHPDIDSGLESYFGDEDYCFKSRKMNDSEYYAILRMRRGMWHVTKTFEQAAISLFDTEELITYLIDQILGTKVQRRAVLTIFGLTFVIAIPIVLYSVIVIGIGSNDDFQQFIVAGIIMVIIVPIACVLINRSNMKLAETLYAAKPNYIQVLEKLAEVEEQPFIKQAIEKRVEKLKNKEYIHR